MTLTNKALKPSEPLRPRAPRLIALSLVSGKTFPSAKTGLFLVPVLDFLAQLDQFLFERRKPVGDGI